MFRLIRFVILLAASGVALGMVAAQNNDPLQPGDPPVAQLISVSAPDESGTVTIQGGPSSVFPGAQLAIRNLYTGETVYAQAGITGTFSATIFGPGNTPFWISPTSNIPNNLRRSTGSIPGGPGTIIYGPFPQMPQNTGTIVTQLVVDGDVSDWELYGSPVADIYSLLNRDSLYVALENDDIPAEYAQMVILFSLDGVQYALTLDPRMDQVGTLRRLDPNPADVGTVDAAAFQSESAVEIRIPYRAINPSNPSIETVTIEGIQFLEAGGSELLLLPGRENVGIIDESDGIVRLSTGLGQDFTRFNIAGPVAGGLARWTARGRANSLNLQPGGTLIIEMDVSLTAPGLSGGVVGLTMLGDLRLQPLADGEGQQAGGGLNSNNGWSNILTPSGLAVTNLRSDFAFASAITPPEQIIRQGSDLVFPMTFTMELPENFPGGLYVPLFEGKLQVGDGEVERWAGTSILGTATTDLQPALSRMPLILNVGGIETARLVWTLFQDISSDGGRGLLATEDAGRYALSNRVHFDSPTYILPPRRGVSGEPIPYPLEPYLLNLLPNDYIVTAPPLIPFFFPGGRLSVRVTRPDGEVDDLGSAAMLQSRLSTAELDERTLFGAQSPVDIYRLTTLNNSITRYVFTQYGEYNINLSGSMEDVWGNRYQGGGIYRVVIAEPLDIVPGMLPGTPVQTGDAFNAGLHLSPGAPADVTMTARIYPLDGSDPVEHVIQGTANRTGYFHAEGFEFETPGEYVIDYEVRYTDAEGRLWAGSLRSAGVIAAPESSLIAHGARGLASFINTGRHAWFSARQLLNSTRVSPRMNFPYQNGDVVWYGEDAQGQMQPVIRAQDGTGAYTQWLLSRAPGYTTPDGVSLERLAVEGELPLTSFGAPDVQAYSYVNAVAPGLTARQFVLGGLDGGLTTYWDSDDPYNGQAGAGTDGDRAGDYLFLFGGAVVRDGDLRATAIYGALGVVINAESDVLGPRVYPPYRGEAGGPNGGALLRVRGQEVNMFFHPTGARPGDVLMVGDTLAIAGQVAPTLPSMVAVTIASPSGEVRQFESVANPVGYFYDPAQDFAVDEPGIWTVTINVRHEGVTSAGQIEPPVPNGGVLGVDGGTFPVYVLADDSPPLNWNDTRADFDFAAAVPYNFNFPLPAGWSDARVFSIVTMPGYVLSISELRVSGGSFSFQYNPSNLARDFPNLESNGRGSGPASADVVTLTFVATGLDADGQPQIHSRSYTIAHDRLTTFG